MAQHEIFVQFLLDSGTKYWSFRDIQLPTQFYEGRLLAIGDIGSEISVLPSEFRINGFSIELDNSDGAITELKDAESFINREVKVYLGTVDSAASFTQQASFQSSNWSQVGDSFRIEFSDRTLLVFDQKISPSLNTTTFPDLPSSDITPRNLIPQVIGEINQSGGGVPAYRIDPASSQSKYRYVACLGTAKSIDQVFKYGVLQGSGYSTSVVTYGTTQVTVIDFDADPIDADRSDEEPISWNGKGLTDDGTTSGTLLQNPSDIIKQLLLSNGFVAGDIDSAGTFTTVKNQFNERGIVGCFCETDDTISLRDLSEKFSESWNATIIITADGKIGLTAPQPMPSPSARLGLPTLKEDQIILDSFEMTGVEFLSSSIKFKYNRNFFKESFKTTEQIDSARALSDLGEAIIETVELPYVSHTSSASGVVHDKSFFMAEGRVVVTLGCEASFFKSLSVGNEIKLSHFRGLGSSGFSDKIFRVIGKSLAADDEALVCSLTLVDLFSDLGLSHQFRKFGNESIMVGEYGFMTGSFQSDMTSMLDTEALYPLFKETPVIT